MVARSEGVIVARSEGEIFARSEGGTRLVGGRGIHPVGAEDFRSTSSGLARAIAGGTDEKQRLDAGCRPDSLRRGQVRGGPLLFRELILT